MILKALDDGVSEDVIARALNVSPKTIRDNRSRLQDIAPEAIELLKDKPIADMALRLLKKAKPFRQVEMAEVMNLSRTYTASYAKTLILATPPEHLVAPLKDETRPEELAKLELELRVNERDFVAAEESYSRDMLNIQLARAYLKALLENKRIEKYLAQKHGELLQQLRRVVEVTSIEG
jgi:ParB-like chromosome segregation protein Spo0J